MTARKSSLIGAGRAVPAPQRVVPVTRDLDARISGGANGRPPLKPYVWRAGEHARDADIAARVASARAEARRRKESQP